jgi:hypothetical protein
MTKLHEKYWGIFWHITLPSLCHGTDSTTRTVSMPFSFHVASVILAYIKNVSSTSLGTGTISEKIF